MTTPNILLLISHDTGRYLGCYGKEVATPAIDRIASEGVRFDNYYCPAPQCSPSRGSILTGRYPQRHGMIGLSHLGFSIHPTVTTLPMSLAEAGYETALIGFSHETIGEEGGDRTSSGAKLGYETVLPVPGDRAGDVAAKTVGFLQDRASGGEEGKRPFFASVGFFETHREFDEYGPLADPADEIVPPPYLLDTPAVREELALLHGSAKALDAGIERIIGELDRLGLSEDTLVIYTTDHGIAFPRAKGTLLDAGLETALLMRQPGTLQAGQVVEDLLCNVDLMPTLLEAAGAQGPEELDGVSFLPLLKAPQAAPPRDHFFAELSWHDQYHPMRAIRTNEFKYIRNFENGPAVYLPLDIHRSPSGIEVRDQYYEPNVPEELYDLQKDPLEQHNLAGNPQYQKMLETLREQVERWMERTDDRLLQGKIPGLMAPEWQEQIDNGSAYSARRNP
ncbi:sulfatase family protein [Paenibacillus daejeonensis]|uniref:sulfatase family protein n=1 Tax=Paenibacillus daejeonensis TaxID=135193 RepID=UPI000373899B|nr:sulfatase [Paenibacillus daejeonensis]